MEPQADVTQADGVAVPSRPDFLLRPVRGEAPPVAVFMDGFEYHRDTTADDSRKRMALARAGFQVWSLAWQDLEVAFGGAAEAGMLSNAQTPKWRICNALWTTAAKPPPYAANSATQPAPTPPLAPRERRPKHCVSQRGPLAQSHLHHLARPVRQPTHEEPSTVGALQERNRPAPRPTRRSLGRHERPRLRRHRPVADLCWRLRGRVPSPATVRHRTARPHPTDRGSPPPRHRAEPPQPQLPPRLERRIARLQPPAIPAKRLVDHPRRRDVQPLPGLRASG